MQTPAAYTLLCLAVLFVVSIFFNRYVDSVPDDDRSDGTTARWVIIGTGYSLLGGAVLHWIWFPHLPATATAVLLTLTIYIVSFSATGLPMYIGDVNRSLRRRRQSANNDKLDTASRLLRGTE